MLGLLKTELPMPIPTDIDLWRSAGLMVRQHGSQAPTAASERAKQLETTGGREGAATRRLILSGARNCCPRTARGNRGRLDSLHRIGDDRGILGGIFMMIFHAASDRLARSALLLIGLAFVGACSAGPPPGYYGTAGGYGPGPGYGNVGSYRTAPNYSTAGRYGSPGGYSAVGSYSAASSYGSSGGYRSSGRCQYPWQYDSAGRRCGNRAASVRPGGY